MKDQGITVQNNHVCTYFMGGKQTFLFTTFQGRQGFTLILKIYFIQTCIINIIILFEGEQTLLFLQLK